MSTLSKKLPNVFVLALSLASITTVAQADVPAPAVLSEEEKVFSEVTPQFLTLFRMQRENPDAIQKGCKDIFGKILNLVEKEGWLGDLKKSNPAAMKMLVEKAPGGVCGLLGMVTPDLLFLLLPEFPYTTTLDLKSKGIEDGDVDLLKTLLSKFPNLKTLWLEGNKLSEANIQKLLDVVGKGSAAAD